MHCLKVNTLENHGKGSKFQESQLNPFLFSESIKSEVILRVKGVNKMKQKKIFDFLEIASNQLYQHKYPKQ